MTRAIVLLSGGIDSAVSLFLSMSDGFEVHPLTFHTFLRPRKEVEAVGAIANAARCKHRLLQVDLSFLKEVDDLKKEGLRNGNLSQAPLAYIPARNLVFYSIAAHYAEILGAQRIVGGHNRADSETFPDASATFFETLNRLLGIGLLTHKDLPVEVRNPLQGFTKAEVVQLGLELSVPFSATWSCQWDIEVPCGDCPSCRERAEAFAEVGLDDPLLESTQRAGL